MEEPLFIHQQAERILSSRSWSREVRRELFSTAGTRTDERIKALIAKEILCRRPADAEGVELCLRAWDRFSPTLPEKSIQTGTFAVVESLSDLSDRKNEQIRRSWFRRFNGAMVSSLDAKIDRSVTRRLLFSGEIYPAWRESQLAAIGEDDRSVERLSYFLLLDSVSLAAFTRDRIAKSPTSNDDADIRVALLVLLARGEVAIKSDRLFQRLVKRKSTSSLSEIFHLIWTSAMIDLSETWKVLGMIETLTRPEERLLALAALARLQRQSRKLSLAQTTEAIYLAEFANWNGAIAKDPWNLLKTTPSSKGKDTLDEREVPTSVTAIHRWKEGMSLSWRLARILGPRRMSRLLAGQSELIKLSESDLDKISQEITGYADRLKGPLMKVGQTASYFCTGLPTALVQPMRKLQKDAEPVGWSEIESSLVHSIGADWSKHFASFDTRPIGIGSIAQVHRARLKTGEEVVLKIRLPEIEKIIKSDLMLFRGLAHLATPFGKALNSSAVRELKLFLDELEIQMLNECDFEREARAMNRARARFAAESTIHIPQVISTLSSREILVQQYVAGVTFAGAMAEPSQEKKDLWGRALVRFVVTSCRDADFNSDPHPGNFLFSEHGIYCLDFGSTITWPIETRTLWNQLIRVCTDKDMDLFLEAFQITESGSAIDAKFNALVCEKPGSWTLPIYQRLSSEVIAEQMREIAPHFVGQKSDGNGVATPPIFLFGMRVYFGHLSLVAQLGSRANWNDLAREIMQQGS